MNRYEFPPRGTVIPAYNPVPHKYKVLEIEKDMQGRDRYLKLQCTHCNHRFRKDYYDLLHGRSKCVCPKCDKIRGLWPYAQELRDRRKKKRHGQNVQGLQEDLHRQ
jgi:NAD-dependent SIR2 family protein deacetylase